MNVNPYVTQRARKRKRKSARFNNAWVVENSRAPVGYNDKQENSSAEARDRNARGSRYARRDRGRGIIEPMQKNSVQYYMFSFLIYSIT